jgi:hypothetical protein
VRPAGRTLAYGSGGVGVVSEREQPAAPGEPRGAGCGPRRPSYRNAITIASVMIDEIRLRAHARPLDKTPGDVAT